MRLDGLFRIVGKLFCLGLFVLLAGGAPSLAADSPLAERKRLSPPLEFADRDLTFHSGRRARLSDFRGKPVILMAWTSTCPYCTAEMEKAITPVLSAYKDQAPHFFNVLVGDTNYTDRDFVWLQTHQPEHPVILTDSDEFFAPFRFGGFPTTLVLDAEGGLIWRQTGYSLQTNEPLRAFLEELLGPVPAGTP